MNYGRIEGVVRELHRKIWRAREELTGSATPRPVELLAPEVAARAMGVTFEVHESLGSRFGHRGERYEVAGLIDRQAGKIAVSRRFKLETRRFTAAHEIGHWLLHEDEVLHRDRPVEGLHYEADTRPPREREADYFAACFLMPARLVARRVEETFGFPVPVAFSDTLAYWLSSNNAEFLMSAADDALDREVALATARSFAGRHFEPLTQYFRVSISSMAIRLKELGVIRR